MCSTTSGNVIKEQKDIFAQREIPEEIISALGHMQFLSKQIR